MVAPFFLARGLTRGAYNRNRGRLSCRHAPHQTDRVRCRRRPHLAHRTDRPGPRPATAAAGAWAGKKVLDRLPVDAFVVLVEIGRCGGRPNLSSPPPGLLVCRRDRSGNRLVTSPSDLYRQPHASGPEPEVPGERRPSKAVQCCLEAPLGAARPAMPWLDVRPDRVVHAAAAALPGQLEYCRAVSRWRCSIPAGRWDHPFRMRPRDPPAREHVQIAASGLDGRGVARWCISHLRLGLGVAPHRRVDGDTWNRNFTAWRECRPDE